MSPSLVADVGGTNTRVALAEGPRVLAETIRRFRNADHPDLESVLRAFLAEAGVADCDAAAVAVAGPVRDGVGRLTNLDWALDRPTLARAARAERAVVLNDLQAQGHALGALDPSHIRAVVPGPTVEGPTARLVVGVGTGFNAAPVIDTERGERVVAASESGHAGLPVRTEAELRLSRFAARTHGFAEVEDVLSGPGLERVYAWLGEEAGDPRPATAGEIAAALARGEARAEEAARVFVGALGAVCGDLALIHLPFGGVFLVGGVARAFRDHLGPLGFAEAFRAKGRFSGFMETFAVHLIEDDYAALTGLASHLAGGAGRAP